jgi:hypothetical protein
MDKQHIIDFIDDWLDENAWRADSRVQDFVLDLRLMLTVEEQDEPSRKRMAATGA